MSTQNIPVKSYQVLADTNWFSVSNGSVVAHPINPNHPGFDFRQGDAVKGREIKISYRVGGSWKSVNVIEIAKNKYINRGYVAVGSGNSGGGEQRTACYGPGYAYHTKGKCKEGETSSFSGAEIVSKITASDVYVPAIGFGAVAAGIGILLMPNVKGIISFAGAGVVLGGLIGLGSSAIGEKSLSAEGRGRRPSGGAGGGGTQVTVLCKGGDFNGQYNWPSECLKGGGTY